MKIALSLVLCVFVLTKLAAQNWAKAASPPKDERLKAGDRLPFEAFHNMVNYSGKDMKLIDQKPKLRLFDFWGVQCAPCIAAWPKLLGFQKEFGKDLQIVLVNKYEDEKQVRDFIVKRKRIYKVDMNLPISTRDTTIWKYFPALGVPRYYWIDSNNVIRAITSGDELTRENIKRWIDSGPFALKEIEYKKWHFVNSFQPIFVNGNGGERSSDVFIWSSSLTKGQTDVSSSSKIYYDPQSGYGISVINNSILGLYATAYNNRRKYYSSFFDYLHRPRTEVIAKDTARFDLRAMGGVNYNYQLISGTPKSGEELLVMMKEDLGRYFNMRVAWEKRKKKCLVFTMFDSTLAKRKVVGLELSIKDMGIAIDSIPVALLVEHMEMATPYRSSWYPIIDETGYKGLLTGIRAEGNAYDPGDFDRMLSKFGMRFKVETREVDVLVLRDLNSTP